MIIVEPYAKIDDVPDTDAGIRLLRAVERYARRSHMSEEAQTETSWERFLTSVVLQKGDWSVTEHRSVTVDMLVDRGIQQELTRHRIAAYTIESTRFVNYQKKGLRFIQPPVSDKGAWHGMMIDAERAYLSLLNTNAPQIARSVLPLCTAGAIYVTYNLRMWRHFFLMRTTKEAHVQMRQVTIPLLEEFQEKIPLLYADIEPGARQADNLRKAK